MGIVVIPGCGDIPGWMLRGVDGECYVGWDSVRSRGVGRCEVLWRRYINMSIFLDF